MANPSKFVRGVYSNCTAKNPSECRYHGKKFVKSNIFKNIDDVFEIADANMKASAFLNKESPDMQEFMVLADELDSRMTVEERQALWAYSDEYGSQIIAWYLNGTVQQHHKVSKEQAMKQVALLDSMIAKSTPATENRTLYRGVKKYYGDMTDLQVGKTITFKSFSSASTDLDTAKDFVTKEAPLLFKIKTKQGAPLKGYFLEYEYILPRDMNFKVTEVEENVTIQTKRRGDSNGYTVVTVEEF